jgi:ribosomal protein S27AE
MAKAAPRFKCPHCGMVSHSKTDIEQRYCGRCHLFAEDSEEFAAAMVAPLVEAIRPLLAGQPPNAVGAALADLLAIWLASHHVTGTQWDAAETRRLREAMLKMHVGMVWRLVAVNEGAAAGGDEDEPAGAVRH